MLPVIKNIVYIYLAVINVSAFAAFYVDKMRAIRGEWRIPESTLWIVTAFGGSLGSLCGMIFCRHKTRKTDFRIGVPVLLAVHLFLVYCFATYY